MAETATRSLSFEDLCRIEPRLRTLAEDLRKARAELDLEMLAEGEDCLRAQDLWFQKFKPRMLKLVGWDAVNAPQELRDSDAYEVAYRALVDIIRA